MSNRSLLPDLLFMLDNPLSIEARALPFRRKQPQLPLWRDNDIGHYVLPRKRKAISDASSNINSVNLPAKRIKNEDERPVSTIMSTDRPFKAEVDVRYFKPEELNVRISGSDVILEAKHEEREDEYGLISRRLNRRYPLHERLDLDRLECELKNGILMISAPLLPQPVVQERIIPIKEA